MTDYLIDLSLANLLLLLVGYIKMWFLMRSVCHCPSLIINFCLIVFVIPSFLP